MMTFLRYFLDRLTESLWQVPASTHNHQSGLTAPCQNLRIGRRKGFPPANAVTTHLDHCGLIRYHQRVYRFN